MVADQSSSADLGLAELGLEDERVGGRDAFPCGKPLLTSACRASCLPTSTLRASKPSAVRTNTTLSPFSDCKADLGTTIAAGASIGRNLRRDERPRPPPPGGVVDRGNYTGGAGILVEQRADEHDVCRRTLTASCDRDPLSFMNSCEVRREEPRVRPSRDRSTMTNSSLSSPSRPTSEPRSTRRSATRPEMGDANSCRRNVSTGCRGMPRFAPGSGRGQRACRAISCLTRASSNVVARPEKIVLTEGSSSRTALLAVEQGLLKVEHQARRQIFALGVGDLAALDHGHDFAGFHTIPEAFAQLRDRCQQSYRPRGRSDRRSERSRRAQRRACAAHRPRLRYQKVADLDLPVAEFHHRVIVISVACSGLVVASRDGKSTLSKSCQPRTDRFYRFRFACRASKSPIVPQTAS